MNYITRLDGLFLKGGLGGWWCWVGFGGGFLEGLQDGANDFRFYIIHIIYGGIYST